MEQPQITSLVITRRSAVYWTYNVNQTPANQERDASSYTGTRDGDYITIKTLTGAVLTERVPFSAIQYIDTLDTSNNMTNPQSSAELQAHLIAQGFYVGSATGSGGGSATTFKSLSDVAVNSFLGREGYIIKVDENGQYLVAVPDSANTLMLQQLQNYLNGTYFPPDSYIMTGSQVDEDGNALGFTVGNLQSIINRPPAFDEPYISRKGYTYVDGVLIKNQNLYSSEIGDIFRLMVINDAGEPYEYYGRWMGGDTSLLENFKWSKGSFSPLPGEPGYE